MQKADRKKISKKNEENKLTKDQVLAIPTLSKTMTVGAIANKYNVSWQAVWYWIKQLRKRGYTVYTRKRGQRSLLDE